MTIEDIFSEIATHMVEGLMIHDQLSQIFCFLNLDGYRSIHTEQYLDESKAYKDICNYYIERKGHILKLGKVNNPSITDESWCMMSSSEIRSSTKKQAIEGSMSKWVAWEQDSKTLYERAYINLIGLGEVSAAAKIHDLVKEVDEELVKAEDILRKLQSIDFDLVAVYDEQSSVYERFTK